MPNLKEVKTRIGSVISTQQITRAMKMVAASKLRKAQDRIILMRPYAEKLGVVLRNVVAGSTMDDNVFGEVRSESKVLLIVITSDRGLCGPFNSAVLKGTLRLVEEKYKNQQDRGDLTVMPIGKKAVDFFRKRNYQIIEDYSHCIAELTFENARKAAEYAMKGFSEEDFDKAELVYNEFKNVATQVQVAEQFLPIAPPEEGEQFSQVDYIYEPSKEFIALELFPRSLKIQLYKALLESNAGEMGARMTAMDKATENAGELLDELKLTYNRTRQAAITKEILEIVGGAEALK
jgi:F-type H+-transporting ATPase subunit gamma